MTEIMWNKIIESMEIDAKKELTKRLLVSILKERGFPVAYFRCEADGSFGYYVEDENTIIPLDYAVEIVEENPTKLIEMPISELGMLLDYGKYKTDKDWEYFEDGKKEALQMIEEIKQRKKEKNEKN